MKSQDKGAGVVTRVSSEQNQQKTASDELASQVQTFDSLMNELAALLSSDHAQPNRPAQASAQAIATQPAKPARIIPRNVQQFPHAERLPEMPRTKKAPVT